MYMLSGYYRTAVVFERDTAHRLTADNMQGATHTH
jgi:hypothetical protein